MDLPLRFPSSAGQEPPLRKEEAAPVRDFRSLVEKKAPAYPEEDVSVYDRQPPARMVALMAREVSQYEMALMA